MIFCQNRDPVDLVDKKKFVDFFHETTGRKDLRFRVPVRVAPSATLPGVEELDFPAII